MFSQISNFFTATTPSRSSDLGGMTEPAHILPQNEEGPQTQGFSQNEMHDMMKYARDRAEKARRARQGHAGRDQKWE
ncbi:hypothetical protein EXIGLDRAFT_761069 [Exidia glandulosa HHB12029]|uniref:Uncharacterized protein n=1 Tax=Exidia glandulosa HHB12029 TaxID=1314781 RepID=A0A165NQ17_EXIGL|nr:hypothetical protein EXIGLDRAFT_761069 [Exidia glandulosa HHB12029]